MTHNEYINSLLNTSKYEIVDEIVDFIGNNLYQTYKDDVNEDEWQASLEQQRERILQLSPEDRLLLVLLNDALRAGKIASAYHGVRGFYLDELNRITFM